jgi:hypothetical protein
MKYNSIIEYIKEKYPDIITSINDEVESFIIKNMFIIGFFKKDKIYKIDIPFHIGIDNISNPVSIMRVSHFTSDISYNIGTGSTIPLQTPIRFGTQGVNQLGITFIDISKTKFIIPIELSGQYIEIYVIQKTQTPTNNVSVTVDISSINNSYNENIDTRFYDRTSTITSTFGPHMIRADEIHSGKIYSLFTYCIASGGGTAKLIRSEIIMKSYYL